MEVGYRAVHFEYNGAIIWVRVSFAVPEGFFFCVPFLPFLRVRSHWVFH